MTKPFLSRQINLRPPQRPREVEFEGEVVKVTVLGRQIRKSTFKSMREK